MTEATSRKETLDRICEIVGGIVGDGSLVLTEGTTAADVRGWDSLSHIQIIMAVEKAFGLRLKASEVAQLNDVGSLIDIIAARRSV